ncbi:hypothetical protein [Marinobacter mobilis]|uniref:hypothetical protein n=1 Tax=Marinobacter mobilis TaxID=488533 RepID=UPI0035C72962
MSNDSQQAAYNESFEPRRGRVEIGALVQSQDVVYRIIQLIDFNTIIGVNVETGRSVPLRIGELRAVDVTENPSLNAPQDLSDIADDDWQIAQKRFAAITLDMTTKRPTDPIWDEFFESDEGVTDDFMEGREQPREGRE